MLLFMLFKPLFYFTGTPKIKKMQKLTNKEEEIMHVLWKLKKAFVKEVMAEITEDQPHYNTLSTIIRNLEEKGFVSHNAFGNTHQYYPLISIEDYRKRFITTAIDTYFDSSYKNMVSFFAKEQKISAEELREILAIIEQK
jgi:BlaI family transcriptional regulator, penicillinase repressor